ncbi:hypothetical protein EF903_05440 [Streptomyces sp. WAC05292]|uniref:hypothetical protein n=1 Tax=Streptomyces sp. WAC05292 TaxID=2487418 RepID=UPI000F73820D|nr:hypothetical protein [Streptomyces sp. WAC05292]RSS95084.1 hypothetical protein EF903_05440 [Streptomyces sp. WAC05292]
MSAAALTLPATAPALFPPPAVPAQFRDGDRYSWPATGDLWHRLGGHWRPVPDGGTGWFTDQEVRHALTRAVAAWDAGHRFEPAAPGPLLPGRRLSGETGVWGLGLGAYSAAAQYVRSQERLVPVRDLVAAYDEDGAYDVPATITPAAMLDVVGTILAEHDRAHASYSDGRLYVRYERQGEHPWDRPVICLHVFVLSGAEA